MEINPTVPAASADAHALLTSYHSPSAALEIFTSKVQNKTLALHPTAAPDARTARRRLTSAKPPPRKPPPLSAAEKRRLGVHALPAKLSYATVQPLHALWTTYARTLGAMGGGAMAMAARLASGDLHGALVTVVRSRAVDRVGIAGIVAKETRGVLVVVTEEDRVKTLPKEFTVFRVEVEVTDEERVKGRRNMVFELQGNQLMFRAAERAGRKFKAKPMLDL